ncbi:MAG: class I SAM-dependent methyltransferase [Bdellovibrionales bacterium]|nr:class I SAM-dependent methyltransferase [Bdellovibrionales bacterium]
MRVQISEIFAPFRGQWGGKISNGEEMWWTEPDPKLLAGSSMRRRRFVNDVRQFFLLEYLREGISRARARGVAEPKVIDFGCGTGGSTLNFSTVAGHPIDGFDVFATQIEIAGRFAESIGNRGKFGLLDGQGRLPLPDASVDVLFSADVLGHVPEIPKTLAEWARVMKKDGIVALFTESTYSEGDRSLMARLARDGYDMVRAVPEHISLFPREKLETWFTAAGFAIEDRVSANVGHFFFFPKDYVLLLKKAGRTRTPVYVAAWIWNRLSKLTPFYPLPFERLRLAMTRAFGREASGTAYFYRLRRTGGGR